MPKISNKKPPHFWIMKLFFRCDWERTAFGFGDTVYAKYKLPHHLIVHEEVHLQQQSYSYFLAWLWLLLYLISKRFRYKMELQAYRKQYKAFNHHEKNTLIKKIAGDLSGRMYGNIVTFNEAVYAITTNDKEKEKK
jgi:hypothetical protein